MKYNIGKRMIGCLVVLALIMSVLLTACDGTSGSNVSNDRETTFTGETQNTVNPDVSEPNQSIPSDAMITETETESTAPVKNGNTYTINGVEFTISVRIEDYLYDLPGSDAKYIDLDKFMEAYGFKVDDDQVRRDKRCGYTNGNGVSIYFDKNDPSIYSNGLGVCTYATIAYPSSYVKDGAIALVTMNRDYSLNDNHVYVVNGYIEGDKTYEKYCVSQEMLVVFAVSFDTLNETGSTASAVESLARACYCRDEGSDGVQRVVIQ